MARGPAKKGGGGGGSASTEEGGVGAPSKPSIMARRDLKGKRANNYSNSKNKIQIANFETKICKPGTWACETWGIRICVSCVLCVSSNTGNCSTRLGIAINRVVFKTAD